MRLSAIPKVRLSKVGTVMKYGYARVSSSTQDYAAQVEALKAAGCDRIFSEKASGKSTNGRPELAKLLKALLPGDAVAVTKLDRIARSSRDLHSIIHDLKERGCGFISLGDTWCDTTNEMGRFMLTVMSGIAELERDLIRKRCQAGIERAKAKGTKFGRPLALDASQRRKIAERYSAGETMAELARDYDCGEATIWRALRGLVAGGPFEHGAVGIFHSEHPQRAHATRLCPSYARVVCVVRNRRPLFNCSHTTGARRVLHRTARAGAPPRCARDL
jgi:DNA invertase Pin-like site-specific DNA recombinase